VTAEALEKLRQPFQFGAKHCLRRCGLPRRRQIEQKSMALTMKLGEIKTAAHLVAC